MEEKCRTCETPNLDDSLTSDGLCFECDLNDSGYEVITEENVRELFDRLETVVERAPSGSLVWDSLLPS